MGAAVQDLQRRQAAVDRLKAGVDESLANEARLHGWRVQNLFETIILCLGSIRLIMTTCGKLLLRRERRSGQAS